MKLDLRVPSAVRHTRFWKFDRNKTKVYPGKQLLLLSAVRGQLTLSASYPRHSGVELTNLWNYSARLQDNASYTAVERTAKQRPRLSTWTLYTLRNHTAKSHSLSSAELALPRSSCHQALWKGFTHTLMIHLRCDRVTAATAVLWARGLAALLV